MAGLNIAQVNVRLPRELKESGDSGLQTLGLSPSDAVRALWMRLSAHGAELKGVRAFLMGDDEAAEPSGRPFEQSDIAQGWRMVDEGIAALGLKNLSCVAEPLPDNDLLAQELEERMRYRGTM